MRHIIKIIVLLSLASIGFPHILEAQRSFVAEELNKVALEMTGAEANWPLIVANASFVVEENRYQLSGRQENVLGGFKSAYAKVRRTELMYAEYLKKGARVFAQNEADQYEALQNDFGKAIREGDLAKATELSGKIVRQFSTVKKATDTRRVESVAASLAEKSGEVDKRKGMLGKWLEALVGDLFQANDVLKTGAKSVAKLDFVDGSFALVDEKTLAVIQRSDVDRLTQVVATEVSVSRGGLLASLSARGKSESDFKLFAGNSETKVESSKFWAFNDGQEKVALSNYDGKAVVSAENSSVELGQNQGTIVVRGQKPMLPVELLPSPRLLWKGRDSVIYDARFHFEWNPVSNTSEYELEIASNAQFTQDVHKTRAPSTNLSLANIPLGTSYVRIHCFDKLGLRGVDSPVYRLLRNEDAQAPPIIFPENLRGVIYTVQAKLTLNGVTETASKLTVNGRPVAVESSGQFSFSVDLVEELNNFTMVATDRSNNKTELNKQIIRISEQKLFDINSSIPISDDVIQGRGNIRWSGKAYPPLRITIRVGERTFTADSGNSGDWSLQFQVGAEQEILVIFINKSDAEVVSEKVYRIK